MGNLAPDGEELLTTAQVAEVTGLSITSVNRRALQRQHGRKLPGRTGAYLFTTAEVASYFGDVVKAAS